MSAAASSLTSQRTLTNVHSSTRRRREVSPGSMARLGGLLLLATIIGGVIAQGFIADRLIVTGDAAATARNIVANQSMVRVAYLLFVIEMACQTATTAVMYELLKPVSGPLARTAAAFGYTGSGLKVLARVFFYAPLFVVSGAPYLAAFNQGQLEAISYLLIRINNQCAGMACVFLGVNTMMVGYLMFRATFLPRALGVLGIIGGAGWISYLYPPLASKVFMPVALFSLFGCALTIGWLVIRGVDEQKWHEQALKVQEG